MQKWLLIIAIPLTVAFVVYGYMDICPNLTPQKRMVENDEVFTARVIDVGGTPTKRTVTLQTLSAWKGSPPLTQTIETKSFELDKEYLIYGLRFDGKLLISKCGGWKELPEAKDDIQALGEPKLL